MLLKSKTKLVFHLAVCGPDYLKHSIRRDRDERNIPRQPKQELVSLFLSFWLFGGWHGNHLDIAITNSSQQKIGRFAMRIPIVLTIAFIICLYSGCDGLRSKTTEKSETSTANKASQLTLPVDPEEYVVYSLLINDLLVKENVKQVVIERNTSGLSFSPVYQGQEMRDIQLSIKGLDKETISDFYAKNLQRYQLQYLFKLKIAYVLINNILVEFEENPKPGMSAWDEFYRKYEGAQGLASLSRVGFNSNKSQALVYLGNQSGLTLGQGRFILLIKKHGIWEIRDKMKAWIS